MTRSILAIVLIASALAEVEECQGGDGEEASLLQSMAVGTSLTTGALPQCEALSQTDPSPCPSGGPMNTALYCVYNQACVTGGQVGCVEQTGCQYKEPQKKCFQARLVANPVAVPAIQTTASGSGTIEVTSDSVTLTSISWTIPDVSSQNPVIGLHIHDGDHSQNGGILVGFCGSVDLPPFSGTCPDAESATVSAGPVNGQGCDLGNAAQGGPCVDAKGTTAATIQGAAAEILSSPNSRHDFYLNLHTVNSFNTNKAANGGHPNPLGLIRGQLVAKPC